ncbi:tryptophan--tRNA ligase [Candidatus Falkowbacteria bacterium RIFOXYB2_FULL_38_15]|uniref:Tryptophan--tRNA ligase n=1 Tax=Candidatus Falkowbacteria bacterium RIFOXYA2_FULL_38_12 TaxID=1797993 RepID=A0A1F5S4R9_9BACT|nr:MAG: tryptophan--tRNA ligase [Candidatus Falkowbacteria bacterium RIFOXYA2_FULL_38_12]OGF32776.1 MAG: tryptophan--tRNA ligase [Candidatus Falkowbacteria bacterium RIFOXYB2_FULL_38_15]OGF42188.1 MAG: tryptophan--tRNA ligase [Candidatus Falkowbacteria bacterium RIFOXYD2_FULL_39_16]
MKPRVFSGIRPSGRLHIGNYFGAIKSWLKLQDEADCIFAVVDYHGLTTPFDPKEMFKEKYEVILDYLAVGVDPKKSALVIQSDLPEHTELGWILGTITPVSILERVPTFKEKVAQHPEYVNLGLLSYPVLMAADILIYKSNIVPVGEDQLPHIELAREIAKRFNRIFGKTFPLPKAVLSSGARVMSLYDPSKKMSKTGGEGILLSDSPEEIWKKLQPAVTDPARKRISDSGNPDVCNIYSLHKLVSSADEIKEINGNCRGAKFGCLDCKKILAKNLGMEFEDFRRKRKVFESNPEKVKEILKNGAEKARELAQKTLREVRKKTGLDI